MCEMFGSRFARNSERCRGEPTAIIFHYNAFVVEVKKTMSHRFLLDGSYTLSKAENETDDTTGSSSAGFQSI